MALFIKKHQNLLILLFLITVFIIVPLVFLRLPSGHDYKYHMGRIYQISQNITHGKWFAPLYYGQINGYGYASPLFYGDVLLHLPAVLVVLGLTVEQALRSYIVLCLSSTALVSYFCAKAITKSSTSALISSVLYTFSSYLCIDYITRVALGEVQAFIFIPVAFFGLYSIICDDKSKWFLLPIGLFGVVISHTLSGAMLAFFFLIFALFFTKKIFSDKQCLKLLGISVVLFFALSAFYIFPMLEQISGEPLRLTDGTTDTIWGTLAQRSMSIIQVISDFNLKSANDPWIPNGIGLAIPIALALVVYFIFKDKKNRTRTQRLRIFDLCCNYRRIKPYALGFLTADFGQNSVPLASFGVCHVFRFNYSRLCDKIRIKANGLYFGCVSYLPFAFQLYDYRIP